MGPAVSYAEWQDGTMGLRVSLPALNTDFGLILE